MKIISLDLSTKSSGIAVFDDEQLIDWNCITASSTDVIYRIKKISTEIQSFIIKYAPDIILLEEVRPEDSFASVKNQHTQKVLMWLQAAVIFCTHDVNPKIKIEYLYPSEWRKICGIKTGRGIKREFLKNNDILFVQEKFGIKVNDDVADACCIGYAYLHPNKEEEMQNWG